MKKFGVKSLKANCRVTKKKNSTITLTRIGKVRKKISTKCRSGFLVGGERRRVKEATLGKLKSKT